MTKEVRKEVHKELRQYGVHLLRAKPINFDTKVFTLLTTGAEHHRQWLTRVLTYRLRSGLWELLALRHPQATRFGSRSSE
jgi:hypothetical protein